MRNPADSGPGSGLPEALFGRPEELIAYVEKLRSTGDLVAAAEVLREALHQGLGTAELRALLARTQRDLRLEAEEQAWLSLVAGTRASIETLLAEERVPAALAVLQEKQTPEGKWVLESTPYGRMQANLEKKGQLSKWITLKALWVLERYQRT